MVKRKFMDKASIYLYELEELQEYSVRIFDENRCLQVTVAELQEQIAVLKHAKGARIASEPRRFRRWPMED